MTTTLEKLRYPIGHFECPAEITSRHLEEWIGVLDNLPKRLERLVQPLTKAQLETPYRPDGWTVRQLVHHIPDSHHHSYIRFKWALTEDKPVIKAYEEGRWAELFDSKTAPVQLSLHHLSAVHAKLVYLLKGLSDDQLQRSFVHPETKNEITLAQNIGHYAWHSNHHYAHIEGLLRREGWI
ncbi:putative metal-dependent hydrolase [Aggregatimonas sangjinii]|uniref:Putative metal-dependent hydrolase n=1 Tax=Aggregatimonas sangjinii TaxID=2583587 RepID=A0A5B7SQD0_9FLAO|nr:putative metal-dependent hydrolase [Aggregatimonas sangjinii]QCX00816.1 putative metal-dependent hydrolase [Aggregatimonas sangjinii]